MKPSILCFLSISFSGIAGALYAKSSSTSDTNVAWKRHGTLGQGPRQEHSVVADGNNIYVVGGVAYDENGNLSTINRVEVYDVVSESWGVAAPLPKPLNHVNIASLGGKIYSLGGLSAGMNWEAVNSSYVYNPLNDVWTTISALPAGMAKGSSAVGVYDHTIYLAGGMTLLQPYRGGKQDSLSGVIAYHTVNDSWSWDFPPLPEPRQHVGGVVVNSTFYVIGGRENDIMQYHNTTYALDLTAPHSGWKKLAPLPTARGSLTCSAVEQYIYCMGGEGNLESPLMIFNETEVYDINNDIWAKLPPMEVPRHGTGSVAIGKQVYVPGGGAATAGLPVGIFDSLQVG